MNHRDVIVMGASMGGTEALSSLLSRLPEDLPAGLCIVQHTSSSALGALAEVLGRRCPLPVANAQDGEPFVLGRVYVAPPDRHLLVKQGTLRVARGPRENRVRPALDPLFRSAAVAYGSRVVGVVLTGLQNDGSAGLAAIKRCGGLSVVQDPEDADFPEMPRNALHAVQNVGGLDYCATLERLPKLLSQLVREEVTADPSPPHDIVLEVDIAERVMSDIPKQKMLGQPAAFGCPECGGPLWEVDDPALKRYRCHVGHAYTATALLADQSDATEKALWIALRTLEERANMLRVMAEDEQARGRERTTSQFRARAEEAEQDAQSVRHLLLGSVRDAA